MIVYLTFCAPQIVACAHVYTNVYLAMQLPQRYNDFRVEGESILLRSKAYKICFLIVIYNKHFSDMLFDFNKWIHFLLWFIKFL